jgi:hypothetical protein
VTDGQTAESQEDAKMDPMRRKILKTGVAATAMAAAPRLLAQQPGSTGTGKFFEKGSVRIYYEEAGSGFPLMLIPGGGLNSTIDGLKRGNPFDAIGDFKGEYRCIRRTCAIRRPASPPALSRSIGRGSLMPTTNSVSWITWVSTSSW